MQIGYKLSSEEFGPVERVELARRAEEGAELPLPAHFEANAKLVTEDAIAAEVICGADPARHVAAIQEHAAAGFDHIGGHQIGPDQEGFFRFYERDVLPKVRRARGGRAA